MIRVVIVDDHPALRAGLYGLLRAEPGIVPVAVAANAAKGLIAVRRARPDVAVVDLNLPDADGAVLTRRLRRLPEPPKVLIYTASSGPALRVPAVLAGASAIVDKVLAPERLFDAIREVFNGSRTLPPAGRRHLLECSERLDEVDVRLVELLLQGAPPVEAATALELDPDGIEARIEAVIAALRTEGAPARRAAAG